VDATRDEGEIVIFHPGRRFGRARDWEVLDGFPSKEPSDVDMRQQRLGNHRNGFKF